MKHCYNRQENDNSYTYSDNRTARFMKKYRLLLIDADDTLFDFHADARRAILKMWKALSLPPVDSLYETYEQYNSKLWSKLEAGEIGIDDIRSTRFYELAADLQLSLAPKQMSSVYEDYLSQEATVYEGVRETLQYLKKKYTLVLASNGIAAIQRGRLAVSSLQEFFSHSILSEEIGVSKPDPSFFRLGLKGFDDIEKASMLMIGDSLRSDIRGAALYGIDACWVNSKKKERPDDLPIVCEVFSFAQLRQLL